MTLQKLFLDGLKDLNSAENQLVKALPKMMKAATAPELQDAFRNHLEETKGQVARIRQVFESIGEKPKAVLCKGMQGLVEEGQEHIEKDAGDMLGDLALIGAGERVEHYEIAAYMTAISMAKSLKYADAVDLLTQSLQEEQKTSKLLFQLANPMLKRASAEAQKGA